MHLRRSKGAPLVIGRNVSGELALASDQLAFDQTFGEICHVPDHAVLRLTRSSVLSSIELKFSPIARESTEANLSGHQYFMHKEIYEQPTIAQAILDRYLNANRTAFRGELDPSTINLEGIERNSNHRLRKLLLRRAPAQTVFRKNDEAACVNRTLERVQVL